MAAMATAIGIYTYRKLDQWGFWKAITTTSKQVKTEVDKMDSKPAPKPFVNTYKPSRQAQSKDSVSQQKKAKKERKRKAKAKERMAIDEALKQINSYYARHTGVERTKAEDKLIRETIIEHVMEGIYK